MEATPDALERSTASRAVATQLRREMQRGKLVPGTRLRQGEVADRFGVSTTPVREAFALLQAQGLVRIDPHRGAIVFHPTVEDLEHLYEIREALELLATEKAMENLNPRVLDDLQQVIDKMRKTKDDQEWMDLNDEFHRRIYDMAGRPKLNEMILDLRDSAGSYIHILLSYERSHHIWDYEHEEILDAFRSNDSKRAKKAVSDHMRNTVRKAIDAIEKGETEPQTRSSSV